VDLAIGILSWPRFERVTDRYGTVMIGESLDGVKDTARPHCKTFTVPAGEHGALCAEVLESRASRHIGDIVRGFYPHQTPRGSIRLLGRGRLFTETTEDGSQTVGVQPDDGRESDWMNPRVLYDLHEHTVRLFFLPSPSSTEGTET
jgi:hypothetical protein